MTNDGGPGVFTQLRDEVTKGAEGAARWARTTWGRWFEDDPDKDAKATSGGGDPSPGTPWTGARGRERWKLSPLTRRMTRKGDDADLRTLVGDEEAQRLVKIFLRVRPSGGRVWLDPDGVATTPIDDRVVFLGRITVTAPTRPTTAAEDAVADAVAASPGATAREIWRRLRHDDKTVRPEAVREVLADRADLFQPDEGELARWRPRGVAVPEPRPPVTPAAAVQVLLTPPAPPVLSGPRQLTAGPTEAGNILPLMPWQVRAVRAWVQADRRGVVEAVTGTGKTHVGLEAVAQALAARERATILIPTVDLQRQWIDRLTTHLPDAEVAGLGGVDSGDIRRDDVVVALVQSASRRDLTAIGGRMTTLVADEVHRYGTDSWSAALRPTYTRRLGLTATLERSDDGVDRQICPYFGPTVMTYNFEQAIADEVVAPFRLFLAPVTMRPTEQDEYDALTTTLSRALSSLRAAGELRDNRPLPQQLAELSGRSDRAGGLARSAVMTTNRRRKLLAELDGKLAAIGKLNTVIDHSQGTVIFTQTKPMAERAAHRLRNGNVAAAAMFGGVPDAERQQNLRDLGTGALRAIAAPKLLDEGIDVPSVDLGIVLAASRSRRQMVQRLGRVIRRKDGGRAVTFVIVYAPGTVEDPDSGAHDGFFGLVGSNAHDTTRLPLNWGGSDIVKH